MHYMVLHNVTCFTSNCIKLHQIACITYNYLSLLSIHALNSAPIVLSCMRAPSVATTTPSVKCTALTCPCTCLAEGHERSSWNVQYSEGRGCRVAASATFTYILLQLWHVFTWLYMSLSPTVENDLQIDPTVPPPIKSVAIFVQYCR